MSQSTYEHHPEHPLHTEPHKLNLLRAAGYTAVGLVTLAGTISLVRSLPTLRRYLRFRSM